MYIAAAIALGLSLGVGLVLGGLVSNLVSIRLFTSPKLIKGYIKTTKEVLDELEKTFKEE